MLTTLLIVQVLTLLVVGVVAIQLWRARAETTIPSSPINAMGTVGVDAETPGPPSDSDLRILYVELESAIQRQGVQTVRAIGDYLETEAKRDRGLEWVKASEDLSEGEALEMIEAGLARYPGSPALLERALVLYAPLVREDEDDLGIRRHALLRMNEHLDRFQLTCRREHLSRTKESRQRVDALAKALITSADMAHRERVEAQLVTLEQAVAQVVADPKADIDGLAELDEALEREGLQQFPDLKERYDKTTSSLLPALRERGGSDPTNEAEYNGRALKTAKDIWDQYRENEESGILGKLKEKDFNDPKELKKVAAKLGGWDARRLLPSTNTYVTSVYSEIFQTLKPHGRAKLTEFMIKEPSKD